jgi:hypothetical protein
MPRFREFDANGDPLAGGLLYTYVTGTATPLATWTSSSQAVTNPNPVPLDAEGFADVWIPSGVSYRWLLHSSAGAVRWDRDPMQAFVFDAALLLPVAGLFAITSVVIPTAVGASPLVVAGFHPANQTVLAMQANVTQQFGASGGLTGLAIGDPGTIDRWGDNVTLTTGQKVTRQGGLPRFSTAIDLWISPIGGTFDATGSITITRLVLAF